MQLLGFTHLQRIHFNDHKRNLFRYKGIRKIPARRPEPAKNNMPCK